jgi:formiminotetrahydrofolate cyclodeaminase
LRDVLDDLAAPPPGSGSGVAVAISLAMAGSLVKMVGAASTGVWPDAAAVTAQADMLCRRAAQLIEDEAEVFAKALDALRSTENGHRSDADRVRILRESAEPPMRLAELAADIAQLGALGARFGNPDLRADAVGAVVLGASGAQAAAHLVKINLVIKEGDPLLVRARWAVTEAERCLGLVGLDVRA